MTEDSWIVADIASVGPSAVYAVLTEEERTRIRQIVAEEVSKVFPIPHTKPDVGIPECPDCHGWVLDEHDPLTPLDTVYRKWWCVCSEKVKAWEEKCKADLDRLLEAIHSEDSEIEAVLAELTPEEFEGIVAKVRKANKPMLEREKHYGVIEVDARMLWDMGASFSDLTTQGELEARGVFPKVREYLKLPESYTIHHILLPTMRRPCDFEMLVDHPDIPLPKSLNEEVPRLRLIYQQKEDGTTELLKVEIKE